jgi:transposase
MSVESLNLPDNVPDLQSMIVGLHGKLNDEGHRYNQVSKENQILRERIRLLTQQLYGSKSEKYLKEIDSSQRLLFELELKSELDLDAQEPDRDREEIEITYTRRKPGRKYLPPELPRKVTVYDLSEANKIHSCGKKMVVIGEERTEKLHMEPAKLWVEVIVRIKYGCECEGVDGADDDSAVRLAPGPVQLIPKSFATASLVSHILISKFCDALPFYRQEKQFVRMGISLCRATMCNWALKIFSRCQILEELLREELHNGFLILLDETPFQVICEEDRRARTKSYMWVARGGPPDQPVVFFHYSPTRSSDVARELLSGFKGYVGTDGYVGYDFLDKDSDIVHFGCWTHARRKFYEVVKASGKRDKKGKADIILSLIKNLYQIESKAEALELSVTDRLFLRQDISAPIVAKIKEKVVNYSQEVLPGTLLGKAISYMLNQWPRLIHFLKDGRIPLDTNRVENDIRPFCVGKKNWLFNYTVEGAHASSLFYTLIETAKANGFEPYSYFRYLLEHLPFALTKDDFKKLLPQYVDASLVKGKG